MRLGAGDRHSASRLAQWRLKQKTTPPRINEAACEAHYRAVNAAKKNETKD
jgi:hypothetical protein